MAETQDPTKSPLLKLPAKLRNHIYSFALHGQEPIQINAETRWHGLWYTISEPPLLLVTQQIRTEALPIFYNGTTLESYHEFLSTEYCSTLRFFMKSERLVHFTGAKLLGVKYYDEDFDCEGGEYSRGYVEKWLGIYEECVHHYVERVRCTTEEALYNFIATRVVFPLRVKGLATM